MRVHSLSVTNFRGIKSATICLPAHAVLIGDNNTGKSSVLEAIDLVLGPDRLSRRPPVDEHDFFEGRYLAPATAVAEADHDGQPPVEAAGNPLADSVPPRIEIEVTITDLSEEQLARFGGRIEWLNTADGTLFVEANPAGIDAAAVVAALRVTFIGQYDPDDDDFTGATYFTRSLTEDDTPTPFRKTDKQHCGFLFLRSLRTGSRALSLEHGSLLDIILRLKEIRPRLWEGTLDALSTLDVAGDPQMGISGVLESVNASLKKYVPREWGAKPHLRVSSLTREHLRKVITAFIATGSGDHAAPFYRQGTGTINMLVLALLSQIAEDKQNVIFAMEEVETAIPPYAQKRIVHELRKLSAQSIITSHSPYVLEEFGLDETVILSRSSQGILSQASIALPESVKHKRYRQDFRTKFCEGLLARRVLIAEGDTEAAALPVVARRLSDLNPATYSSIEGLGITVINAKTETQIADLGRLYAGLGKRVFALCDLQTAEAQQAIEAEVEQLFMHPEKGIEDLVLKNTTLEAMNRFSQSLAWPPHLAAKHAGADVNMIDALMDYFQWSKGNWGIADFLAQCSEAEIPLWFRQTCARLRQLCDPPPPPPVADPAPGGGGDDFDALFR
ncbi:MULTISPECIES: ATP-dependent nuclease [Sphingomonadales]|jgi:putative ATP-dependent endonuclease of OLD family|uniref:Putative endonuclease n=1 Tax=Novosphingobium subterraneum TaxID=48936 RepID=A0A0B8ZT15_9SPHN|nr:MULTISPECIES: AAA family ATPase [Sphingomonadales]KHS49340.1 putative endonuclease [Novosphingobium subterraneum]KHS49562.1 putative endonuclease [Novosphingobium subterraneum]